MSEWQVERIKHYQQEASRWRAAYESQTNAYLLMSALAVIGWAAMVLVLVAC